MKPAMPVRTYMQHAPHPAGLFLRRLTCLLIATLATGWSATSASATVSPGPEDQPLAMTTDPAGQTVMAGTSCGQYSNPNHCLWALARFTSSGQLDSTFGGDGRLLTDWGGEDNNNYNKAIIDGVAVDGAERVVAAGRVFRPPGATEYWAVARYTAAGQLDGSFGSNGRFVEPEPNGRTGTNGPALVATQSDGKVLFGGYDCGGPYHEQCGLFLQRLTANGQIDPSFGEGGTFSLFINNEHDGENGQDDGFTETFFPEAIAIQPDNKIVTVGYDSARCCGSSGSETYLYAVRLTSDGALDPTFGNGTPGLLPGEFEDRIGPSYQAGLVSAVITPEGKIAAGGWCPCGTSNQAAPLVIRLTSAGQLDPGFGSGGLVSNPTGESPTAYYAWGLAAQGSDLLTSSITSDRRLLSVRVTDNGTLDPTYAYNQSPGAEPLGYSVLPTEPWYVQLPIWIEASTEHVIEGTLCDFCGEPSTGLNFLTAELHTDGSPDSSVGSNGLLVTDFGDAPCAAVANPNAPADAPGLNGPRDGLATKLTSLTFSWLCSGADSYGLYLDGKLVQSTSGLRATVKGLTPGQHTWFIRARNGAGTTDSTTRSFMVLGAPVRFVALGDSVTAGFGYSPSGSPLGGPISLQGFFAAAYQCASANWGLQGARFIASSANCLLSRYFSTVRCGLGAISFFVCQSPNVVSYPAYYAHMVGLSNAQWQNFAVSGSTPANWWGPVQNDPCDTKEDEPKHLFYPFHGATGIDLTTRLKNALASHPTLTVLTLGGNPLLQDIAFPPTSLTNLAQNPFIQFKLAPTPAMAAAIAQRQLDDHHVVCRLRNFYERLLNDPGSAHNHVFVFLYHHATPLLMAATITRNGITLDTKKIDAVVNTLNAAIATAVREARADLGTRAFRLQVISPDDAAGGSFSEHTCLSLFAAAWTISSDTCIHPNALGYQRYAQALAAHVPNPQRLTG